MGRAGGAPRSSDFSGSRRGSRGAWWKLGFGSSAMKVTLGSLRLAPSCPLLGLSTLSLGVLGARAQTLVALALVAGAPAQMRGRREAAMLLNTRDSGAGLALFSLVRSVSGPSSAASTPEIASHITITRQFN